MLGRATQTIFVKVYVPLVLTLFLWVYTLAGGIIFGFGPGLRAITELFQTNRWDYKKYSFKQGWRQWRTDFWAVNAHTWLFLGIFIVLGYNLYLSTQISASWILFVQFMIVFALLLTFTLGVFTLLLRSHYDVGFKDAVKLALMQFFASFNQLLVFVIATIAVGMISFHWPGLLLFLTPGAYLAIADWLSAQTYAKIDALLAE